MKFVLFLVALGMILPVASHAQSVDNGSCDDALKILREDSSASYDRASLLLSKCACFDTIDEKSNAKECYQKVADCCQQICPEDDCDMKTTNLLIKAEKGMDEIDASIRPPPGGMECVCKLSSSYESIIARYNKSISKNQEDVTAWNDRGALLAENCCFDEALRSFEEAIRINPDLAVPWYNKGVLLFELKPDESLECFNRSIKINPDLAEAWFNRFPLLMSDQIDMASPCAKEALASYDQALQLKPELENYSPPLLEFERMA